MKGCGCLLLTLIGAVLLVKFSLSLIYYVVIAAVVLWLLSKVLGGFAGVSMKCGTGLPHFS